MRPDFRISGLSAKANDRVLSVSVDDSAGIKSDKATLILDDRDYLLEWPQSGQIITVEMGYKETGLMMMGTFEVDEISHTDAQVAGFQITANAQTHTASNIKAPQTLPYDEKTLGQIVGEIAGRNGYTPEVHIDVAGIPFDHIDQREESDTHFLSRLAERFDCYVKFQDGKLLFKPRERTNGIVIVSRGSMTQITSKGLKTIGISLNATANTRNEYKSCKAAWHNVHTGERVYEVVGVGDPQYELRSTFESKQAALDAAGAKLKGLGRGTGQINSLSMPGDPSARAEMTLQLVNFRPEVCNKEWIITNAVHTIDSGGYVTSLKADVKGAMK